MKQANTTNLLTLIDSADAAGDIYLLPPDGEPMQTKAHAKEWLLAVFMTPRIVEMRLDVPKKSIEELDLRMQPVAGRVCLTLNLAKLLQLPGQEPAAELAAYRGMVERMRAFFEAHPAERCSIQICNERDSKRRVYGALYCRVPSLEQEDRMAIDDASTAAVSAYVESVPALAQWLRNVALTLQKIGPWASTNITEDDLFGFTVGPYSRHCQEQWKTQPPVASSPEEVVPLDI